MFDFGVPDDIWEQIVPPDLRHRVVCISCFDSFASHKGIRYAASMRKEIYFVGDMANMLFIRGSTQESDVVKRERIGKRKT